MAYDEELADRIREALSGEQAVTEKAMFGGLAFLIKRHMTVVASGRGGLMLRVDPESSEALVAQTPAELMVMRGRQMKGWLYLEAADATSDEELQAWVTRTVEFSATLPPKD
jgi:TfoX/Sxy family transcriptional regulator of competence genes